VFFEDLRQTGFIKELRAKMTAALAHAPCCRYAKLLDRMFAPENEKANYVR